jgi:hypothetical protein
MREHPLVRTALLLAAAAVPAAAQTPAPALRATFAGNTVGQVSVTGAATFYGTYDGGTNSGGIPVEGTGTRMMWYPEKAAFRAGYVTGTQWDDANVGYFSLAIGNDVRASGDGGTAFGTGCMASGISTFAVGEGNTASGAASVALGYHAHTNARQGSFVFADRSSVDEVRAGVNHSANWRVAGGFRIFTSSNLATGVTIQSGASVSNWGQSNAVISTSTGAYLSTSGVWTNTSDVNRKHRFATISGEDVLTRLRALPITSWSYKADAEGARHLGPTAQDFHAAFGLGQDETAIGTVDADGVALAGVQALDRRTDDQAARIGELEASLAELQATNDELRARLARLESALAPMVASR